MTGSAFLTLVAQFRHIRGESELLCNTVNSSLSKIDLRESLSSPFRQDVLKIFSVLMYDDFGCGSLDSSLDVLFEGKFP